MPDDPIQPPPEQRPSLFLSYARADRPVARRLAAALTAAGYHLWWDNEIEGGAQFASAIADALDRADAVVVLWSAHSVGSDWVRDEAGSGRDRHRLVPLTLDGTPPPLGFRQYHAIDLAHWRGRAGAPEIAAVTRAITTVLGTPQTVATPQRASVSRRQALAAASGAGLVAIGGGAWWGQGHGWWGGATEVASIAVLPFRNLSADPQQAYFAAGLCEEVRAALRRVAGLKVMAAASSEAARDSHDDSRTIADKLGVAYLLDGSVQKSADVVRIGIDLTDGRTGFSRWSTQVDRKLTDIFLIENELATMAAHAMSARLATATPGVGGTSSIAAYDLFLRGRALYDQGKDEASDRQALADFDGAIAADPRYALAHAARSRSLVTIAGEYAKASELQPLYDQGVAAAQQAIDLAPTLAEGQLAMGQVLLSGKLKPGPARPFFDRAYQLGRSNGEIVRLFALYCSRVGRAADAQAAIAADLILDPLNARSHRASGSIDYAARNYQAAIPPLQRALQLNPLLGNTHALISLCRLQLGDIAGATAEARLEPRATFRLTALAIARFRAGDRAGGRASYDQLVREIGDGAAYQQAEVLAQSGDPAGAFAAIGRALAVGDSGLMYAATDPMLDPLRKTPEFTNLLRRLGYA